MANWLIYLLEVSCCHALFYLLYRGLLRNLSFFQTNRIYLLSAALLGVVIPAIEIPFWENQAREASLIAVTDILIAFDTDSNTRIATPEFPGFVYLLFSVYILGLILHFSRLVLTIVKVGSLIKKHGAGEQGAFKTVHLNSGPAVFVFLNYVFINTNKMNISSDEFKHVMEHERNHVFQKHTLDNILMELIASVFWFNPILRLMKRELSNVHEFYADQKVMQNTHDPDGYSRLIMRLSSNKEHIPLTHQFSMVNIKQRIIMLNRIKNNKSQLWRYAVVVPCLLILLVSFSCVEKSSRQADTIAAAETSLVIGKIIWQGNTQHTSAYLTDFMGIKEGDAFNEALINQRLSYQPEGRDLASLYMDKGYLFFTVNVTKEAHAGTVDLLFDISEGDIITINDVLVTGNKNVTSEKILSMISLKRGEIFNRSKLLASQRKIAESGLVEPENVVPNLIPNPGNRTVDIEFKVIER
jgi:hypothetical protein